MARYNKAVMCRPTHFEVTYTINPWMGGTVKKDLAMEQWNTLRQHLEDCGVHVDVLEQAKGLPDMAFCCNAGIVRGNRTFLSHFKHPERQGEENHYLSYFRNHNYDLYSEPTTYFEGGGDAVFSSPTRLWAGYGERTTEAAYRKIYDCFNSDPAYPQPLEMILCKMTHPSYYHLDTCFCPLDDTHALYYPPAFASETLKRMAAKITLIPVCDKDAVKFACNGNFVAFLLHRGSFRFLAIFGEYRKHFFSVINGKEMFPAAISVQQAKTVLLPAGCDETEKTLEKHGWSVRQVDLSEFMKAGGAVQCLILRLI